jgi:hypothetical protein
MNLLIESILMESPNLTGNKDSLKARFKFLEADNPSRSTGRTYPKDVLAKAIKDAQAKLDQGGSLYGSTSHTKGRNLDVDDVSHSLLKLEMVGSSAFTEAHILPTTKGRNLLSILKAGGSLGVSARGFGTVNQVEGKEVVAPGYELVGVDVVLDPAFNVGISAANIFESAGFDGTVDEKALSALYENAIKYGYKGSYLEFRKTFLRRK